MTSVAQNRAIHTLMTRAGLAKDDYRALLLKETGKASSTELSDQAAGLFIEVLKGFAGQAPGGRKPAADRATGKYAPVLQALWLSAWNLGLTRTPGDAGLLAFVKRQTGVDHTRFLTDHGDATQAIEGLKKWIAREGGVEWPPERGEDALVARKHEVVRAIAARLVAIGAFTPFQPGGNAWPTDFEAYGFRKGLPAGFQHYGAAEWDRLASYLGARLRAALAQQHQEGSNA